MPIDLDCSLSISHYRSTEPSASRLIGTFDQEDVQDQLGVIPVLRKPCTGSVSRTFGTRIANKVPGTPLLLQVSAVVRFLVDLSPNECSYRRMLYRVTIPSTGRRVLICSRIQTSHIQHVQHGEEGPLKMFRILQNVLIREVATKVDYSRSKDDR